MCMRVVCVRVVCVRVCCGGGGGGRSVYLSMVVIGGKGHGGCVQCLFIIRGRNTSRGSTSTELLNEIQSCQTSTCQALHSPRPANARLRKEL